MTCSCIAASKTAWRPLPSALARYIATSASRITCSGADFAVASAIPIDAPMNSSRPSSRNGACRLCRTRSAITVASRGLADVVEQQRELVAAQARDRVVGPQRRLQPSARPPSAAGRRPAWPSESLMTLKRSRSRNSTAAQHSGWWRWARRIDWSRRSTNRTRFGRPVSASCSASCWRRRSASRRSVTSVTLPTIRVALAVGVAHRGRAREHPAVAAVAVLHAVLELELLGRACPAA